MTEASKAKKSLAGRPSFNLLPGVRTAMAQAGFTRVSTLWQAFRDAMEDAHKDDPALTFSYQRILDLTSGERCFDKESGGYTPLAELMADFLKAEPCDLYGSVPDSVRVHDIDPDQMMAAERTEGFTQPEDHVLQRERERAVQACFDKLTEIDPRGARVLRLLHGLDEEGPLDKQGVAEVMGITTTRVSFMEARATARLKHLITRSYAQLNRSGGWGLRYDLNI